MWNGVQKWLDNADLPFKHVFRSAADELTFSEVYPHFFDYIFRLCRNFVIIDDVPKKVFSQVETIKKIGLDVPQVTELCCELRKRGIDLPDDIITVEECKAVLLERLKGNKK